MLNLVAFVSAQVGGAHVQVHLVVKLYRLLHIRRSTPGGSALQNLTHPHSYEPVIRYMPNVRHQFRPIKVPAIHKVARLLAWLIASILLLNTLFFVWTTASPVIQQDGWYFLDVFLGKAIDGSLDVSDFFVKRHGADHAQPLVKFILLIEWKYFYLNFVVEAIVGLAAGAICAAILYWLVVSERLGDRSVINRYLAWASICAVLFSLNSGGHTWTWPLVALGNVTTLVVLIFMIAAWHAHETGRYLALALVTLVLGITSDDSALIAAYAVMLALLLIQICDSTQRRRSTWVTLLVIVVCMTAVRIGYAYAPVIGGSPSTSVLSNLGSLVHQFGDGGWWRWVLVPLALSVYYSNPLEPAQADVWMAIQVVIGILLVFAHVAFWRAALFSRHNRATFVAVSLMLLTYAWVAGIVLGRVSVFGNDYLNQPRYILLYAGHLIALLLMWAGLPFSRGRKSIWSHSLGTGAVVVGCVILLMIQVPLSVEAWRVRPYQWLYDIQMANQIDQVAKDPVHSTHCLPEIPICGLSLEERGALTRVLEDNRLNIYSPDLQRLRPYLPKLAPEQRAQDNPPKK